MSRAYDEIIDFIAGGTSPDTVAAFQPSDAANERVAELILKQKEQSLTADEAIELADYLQLEHIMRLAKARARRHLP
jgi:hypothetical protein